MDSNTTLVKVKLIKTYNQKTEFIDSNTTLVKVKCTYSFNALTI